MRAKAYIGNLTKIDIYLGEMLIERLKYSN
jgi:hypothetical protein